jgi:hypothetical protein
MSMNEKVGIFLVAIAALCFVAMFVDWWLCLWRQRCKSASSVIALCGVRFERTTEMTETVKIEYKVRLTERFIVTWYEEFEDGNASSRVIGEYPKSEIAHEVGYAMARADHERMGWPPADERIRYPGPVDVSNCAFAAQIGYAINESSAPPPAVDEEQSPDFSGWNDFEITSQKIAAEFDLPTRTVPRKWVNQLIEEYTRRISKARLRELDADWSQYSPLRASDSAAS